MSINWGEPFYGKDLIRTGCYLGYVWEYEAREKKIRNYPELYLITESNIDFWRDPGTNEVIFYGPLDLNFPEPKFPSESQRKEINMSINWGKPIYGKDIKHPGCYLALTADGLDPELCIIDEDDIEEWNDDTILYGPVDLNIPEFEYPEDVEDEGEVFTKESTKENEQTKDLRAIYDSEKDWWSVFDYRDKLSPKFLFRGNICECESYIRLAKEDSLVRIGTDANPLFMAQINGRSAGWITVPPCSTEIQVMDIIKDSHIWSHIKNKHINKTFLIPNFLINLIVDDIPRN